MESQNNHNCGVISIIVPVYQAEYYLACCINSILAQTFAGIEVILVDDGSTDRSPMICDEYASHDCRIKVIHKLNGGVCSARNAGLAIASGEWVTFVDADDYILPEALGKLYAKGMASQADIVFGNILRFKNGHMKTMFHLDDREMKCEDATIPNRALWGYLYRRDVIEGVSFLEGLAYSEDHLFNWEVFLHCKKMAFVVDPVYVYRINDTSACASKDGIRKARHQFLSAKMLRELTGKAGHCHEKAINREAAENVRYGIYAAISTGSKAISSLRSLYFEFFRKDRRGFIEFYKDYLHLYFTYYRRKILVIHKDL